jgi:hypothetical protein
LIFGAVLLNIKTTYTSAVKFARDGIATNLMLDNIDNNTDSDTTILLAADPAFDYEWSQSLNIYLKYVLEREQVYIYPILTQSDYSDEQKHLINLFDNKSELDILENPEDQELTYIIIFPDADTGFYEENSEWFDPEVYSTDNISTFTLLKLEQ